MQCNEQQHGRRRCVQVQIDCAGGAILHADTCGVAGNMLVQQGMFGGCAQAFWPPASCKLGCKGDDQLESEPQTTTMDPEHLCTSCCGVIAAFVAY